jgi:hypothetical protein
MRWLPITKSCCSRFNGTAKATVIQGSGMALCLEESKPLDFKHIKVKIYLVLTNSMLFSSGMPRAVNFRSQIAATVNFGYW